MLFINIDKNQGRTLSNQVYQGIKEAILKGILAENQKLPSTRELAEILNVSRNTIIEGYEQLAAEGYIITKKGSGSYVNGKLAFSGLYKDGDPIKEEGHPKRRNEIISFRTGVPDLSMFPVKKWTQIYQQTAWNMNLEEFDYADSMGDYELREQLSAYLNRRRGTVSSPDNIIITSGAAQSFNLLCQLVAKDEYVNVENPLSYGLHETLKENGVNIKYLPVDEQGVQTNNLSPHEPKMIFTTPSHQFPTGAILTAKRRIELVQYAQEHGIFVVEDDYDSEFRFDGNPIQSMQSLDPEHVIYVGTFSKTLIPALRIGYMILPNTLRERIANLKYIADIHSTVIEQKVLANFLQDGHFERHIRKMNKEYYRKRNELVTCMKERFGGDVIISGEKIGLHLVARFPQVNFTEQIIDEAYHLGIEITAMKKFCLAKNGEKMNNDSLALGYGNVKREDISKGIDILYSLIAEK